MVTIETDRRTLIVSLMDRSFLHNIAEDRRGGVSLTRYGKVRDGGLLELALGRFGMHVNYHTQA